MIPKSNLKFNIKLPIFFITLNQFSQNPPQKFIFHIFTFQNRGIIINSLFLVPIITKNFVLKNTRLQSDAKRIRSSVFIDARCIKSHRKEQKKKKDERKTTQPDRGSKRWMFSGAIDIAYHPRRPLNSFPFFPSILFFLNPPISVNFSSLQNGRLSLSIHRANPFSIIFLHVLFVFGCCVPMKVSMSRSL